VVGGDLTVARAVSLGGGRIAVTGADYTSGRTETTAGPLGLKVIDTHSWRVETLDDETSHVFRYGDTLLATADVTESRPARACAPSTSPARSASR
jgi:hypothetical protein